jgi:hypothetical protein
MVLLVGCLPPAPMDGKSKKGGDEGYDPLAPLPEFERSGPTPEDAPPPNPNAYVVPERGEAETPSEYDDLLDDVFVQFKAENFKKIEKYRKKLTPTHVAEFVNQWDPKLPWDVKNGFVHLLVDRDEVGVGRIMSDGLKSPREHIRGSAAAWIEASNAPVIAAEEAPVIAAEEAPDNSPPMVEHALPPPGGFLMPFWNQGMPWEVKDVFVQLFATTPQYGSNEVMGDGLFSPTVETRATAVIFLSDGATTRAALLGADGELSPKLVGAAVATTRTRLGF